MTLDKGLSTVQALVVVLAMVLPGASYTFAYERAAGTFGVKLADRLVRFVVASALFHAVFIAPEVIALRSLVPDAATAPTAINPWWLELAAVVYVGVPVVGGVVVGRGYKAGKRWAGAIVGREQPPRAWDYLWRFHVVVVRVKLKQGTWLAGIYGTAASGIGRKSYASGYPEEGDIYLSRALKIDGETGSLETDAANKPILVGNDRGLLVRWCEVEYLDVQVIEGVRDK